MLTSSFCSSSPFSPSCSTPSRSSYYSARSHQPINSSPLASPSNSSPTHDVQERRRAQYKPITSASYRLLATSASAKLLFRAGSQTSEEPQKALLRERLQARCRQHAQKLRERAVKSRRSSDECFDVFMDCDDEEESDDVVMQDELFRRIMQSAKHKKNHSYRVSYAIEVGSSFDPDMEDASVWESELRGKFGQEAFGVHLSARSEQKSSSTEPTPEDLAEEELLEYAEHYATLADSKLDMATDDLSAPTDMKHASVWESELREQKSSSTERTPGDLAEEELFEYAGQHAALADLSDLDLTTDDLTALSDFDDTHPDVPCRTFQLREICQTSEMDVS